MIEVRPKNFKLYWIISSPDASFDAVVACVKGGKAPNQLCNSDVWFHGDDYALYLVMPRDSIEAFSDAFVHGNLADFRSLLIENDCRYVLANRDFWSRNLYIAGIQVDANWRPDPRTPIANFSHPDPRVYENLPGFRLVFRSADLSGPGYMRVFELVE